MNDKKLHIDNNTDNSGEQEKFFRISEPAYNKSKDEILNDILNKIETKNHTSIKISPVYYSAAAVILLLISLGLLMRFYSQSISSPKGKHMVYILPDNSKITLNAETKISYHPFWWFMKREVKIDGEAFFEVSKGEKFEVKSEMGTTAVLGTSFNVLARNKRYKVDCFTGKVKVSSNTKEELILTPSYSAEIQVNGNIKLSKFSPQKNDKGWINNMFNFNAVPLREVLKEVERQFNIRIEADIADDLIYTGNFSSDRSVEETLNVLCKPFGLEYEKINNRIYRLK